MDVSSQELEELRRLKVAFELHQELSSTFVTMAPRSAGGLLLRSMLRKTLELLSQLVVSEESSLFWLDASGMVTESILARGIVIREQRESVVGQVLEHGLAGWVYRERKMGVIQDTDRDPRWLQLPYQPYETRSVVCVPLIRGNRLLAIATLMHSQPGHFEASLIETLEVTSQQFALVLDQMRFFLEAETRSHTMVREGEESTMAAPSLAQVGVFMVDEQGRFVYADPQIAELFGYSLPELVALESLTACVTQQDYESLAQALYDCFYGKQAKVSLIYKGLAKHSRQIQVEMQIRKTKLYGQYLMVGTLCSLERK